VGQDLPFHALEGVVDRLAVALELVAHRLVGVAVEIETESLRLEPGEARAETADDPGSASPSVQSPSESWPAGVWLKET